MPLQNRVLPTGEIVAQPTRGTFTGNRGILHRPDRTLGTARWRHKAWICCVLNWQNRRRQVMTGRNWTELFFLDEAVAFAAGHRPCAYCRRADYDRFQAAWCGANGARQRAPDIDAILHRARVRRDRSQVTYAAEWQSLPDGAFVQTDDRAHVVWGHDIYPYKAAGYGPARTRPTVGQATVMTPAPLVAVLATGYRPKVTALPPTS